MTDLYTALISNDNALLNEVLADAGVTLGEDDATIRSVCEDVNTLTFNRITDYFALTKFQRDTLLRVCSRFLRFKIDNAELLDSALRSYGINGVSMSFDDAAVKRNGGVIVPGAVYALLRPTRRPRLRL